MIFLQIYLFILCFLPLKICTVLTLHSSQWLNCVRFESGHWVGLKIGLCAWWLQITGAKAPPLKHLKEWLEQNPTFDVDPKWGELLRAKVRYGHCHGAVAMGYCVKIYIVFLIITMYVFYLE